MNINEDGFLTDGLVMQWNEANDHADDRNEIEAEYAAEVNAQLYPPFVPTADLGDALAAITELRNWLQDTNKQYRDPSYALELVTSHIQRICDEPHSAGTCDHEEVCERCGSCKPIGCWCDPVILTDEALATPEMREQTRKVLLQGRSMCMCGSGLSCPVHGHQKPAAQCPNHDADQVCPECAS